MVTTIKETYNGWKNRQTWNVALWINNEESLYRSAVEFMKQHTTSRKPYIYWVKYENLTDTRTPDNISYSGTKLDYKALNEMMKELLD